MIYLDNCATTRPRPEVIEEVSKTLSESFANSSSLHTFGMKIEEKIKESRKIVADYLNVSPKDIYFTSGGSESNNTLIKGLLDNKTCGKIITTSLEHSAVLEVYKKYEALGFDVVYLKTDNTGKADLEDLEKNMDDSVILVSMIHVNNEIGTINNIKEACKLVKSINKKTIFHSDGVQALGKISLNLKDLGVDAYSISGHKIHALKGIGLLYLKKGLSLEPLILGGNQEKGLRSGTENTSGIFSLSKAVEILKNNFEKEDDHKKILRDRVVDYIKNNMTDFEINTPLDNSPNSILNVSFLHTRGEVILHYLEQDDIYISTTSACHSNKKTKTNLEKMNKSKKVSDGAIRICFSYDNTLEEIDYFLEKLQFAVEDIRKITMRIR